jgi:hypothetical protein
MFALIEKCLEGPISLDLWKFSVWTGAIALYNSYLMTFIFEGLLKKKSHQNPNALVRRDDNRFFTRLYPAGKKSG